MSPRAVFPLFAVLWTVSAKADYLDDTGFTALKRELGDALPSGSGVGVTQVEFGLPAYLPRAGEGAIAGTGNLAGKTIHAKSGPGEVSGHAREVAGQFYGLNTDPRAGRANFTPGVREIDAYGVDSEDSPASWLAAAWLRPEGGGAPRTETRAVQNHSWISSFSPAAAAELNNGLRRLDYAIHRDGFLCVAGVGNGASFDDTPPVPAYLASAYNVLSVGLSSGVHSTGGVPAGLDGPGRQKPEIVAPLDYTSYSTALVSSAAVLLREKADTLTPNARLPQTLKAVLLAGATKEKFPAWTRSVTAPLDARYGAGELNVYHGWHILAGGEQPANAGAPLPGQAWSVVTLRPSETADWLVRVPPGMKGTELSVTAVWHRVVRNLWAAGERFEPAPDPLADYNLTLSRLPAGREDGEAVTVDESRSAIDNLEHLYRRDLPSGTYRLRLSLDSAVFTGISPGAVAWRLRLEPNLPELTAVAEGGRVRLTFTGLLPGQAYEAQHSVDLRSWTVVDAFTAEETTRALSLERAGGGGFYRLRIVDQ